MNHYYRNDLLLEATRRQRHIETRRAIRNEAAAMFGVSALVIFFFLLAQLVAQAIGALA